MKKATLAMLVLAMALTSACKKKEAKPEAPAPAAENAPAPKAAEPAAPAGPAIPEVALTGSASENLVAVFEAGVNALKGAGDAKTGAAIMTGMLAKYDVADLREKSKAAKAAGEGASEATKAKFKALKAEYAELSTKLGASDPKAFGEAAKAWAAAWGLN
jgi:Na+-transporting methylmalonyl-CoA/oxaloacetate decarboxylase gamma subunit